MSVSVRIDDTLVEEARVAAKAEFRTVQGQIEFWAKVGRAALDNPDGYFSRSRGRVPGWQRRFSRFLARQCLEHRRFPPRLPPLLRRILRERQQVPAR